MDKPTIKQHTTPRAARQGAAAGASFYVDLETRCDESGAVISFEGLRRRAILQAVACKHYSILGTVTGRLTDRRNVQTLTRRQKRRQ